MKKSNIYRWFLWIFLILSFFFLLISPKNELVTQIKNNIPWVAAGILISEILLTFGFLMMLYVAAPAFIKKTFQDFNKATSLIIHLKNKIKNFDWAHVSKKCNESSLFWLGFWLSVIGACGDGIVIIWGIGKTLPITSWGLMILPFWDLSLTYIIRKAIYSGVKN